jgi:hypothetical protein
VPQGLRDGRRVQKLDDRDAEPPWSRRGRRERSRDVRSAGFLGESTEINNNDALECLAVLEVASGLTCR